MIWVFTEGSVIWFATLWINQTSAKLVTLLGPKQILISERRVWDYIWSYKWSMLQFLSGRVELKGLLFLGTAVWREALHSWLLSARPPAHGPDWTSWVWKLFLALCFLLHTFPPSCYKTECPAWSYLSICPQALNILQLTFTLWAHHSQSRVALMNLKECYQSIS